MILTIPTAARERNQQNMTGPKMRPSLETPKYYWWHINLRTGDFIASVMAVPKSDDGSEVSVPENGGQPEGNEAEEN